MSTNFTVTQIYKRHKQAEPESGISLRALRVAVQNGELPSVRVGNRSYINEEAFAAWLKVGDLRGLKPSEW